MRPLTPEGGRLIALSSVVFWLILCVPLFWANDAWGYLAAGQRLNANHELYALGSGDMLVQLSPPYWTSPFLYPPVWGIVWRLLASTAGGLAIWMAVVSIGMLWWALRARWWLPVVLGPSFGLLLASGNVAGLFLVAFSLIPSFSQRKAGMLVGAMAAIKLFPAVLLVWFVATRRWAAVLWTLGTGAVLTLAAFAYDPRLTWQYVTEVLPSTTAMGIAPAAWLGIPWVTWVILGLSVVVCVWKRSYAAAVVGVVLGAPAVGIAGLAMLGGALPILPQLDVGRRRAAIGVRDAGDGDLREHHPLERHHDIPGEADRV